MTTIAWDGKTLAGDSFAARGGLKHLVRTKVWRLVDGRLFGGCGSYEDVLAVKAWLDEGGDEPKVDPDFAALLVEREGRCWLLGSQFRAGAQAVNRLGWLALFLAAAIALGTAVALLDALVTACGWRALVIDCRAPR